MPPCRRRCWGGTGWYPRRYTEEVNTMVLLDLQALELSSELNGCDDRYDHDRCCGSDISLLLCGD
ncbi:MAG: SapB/AmfS family lanthipeptide [Pseudonocardiaceae bacterium]